MKFEKYHINLQKGFLNGPFEHNNSESFFIKLDNSNNMKILLASAIGLPTRIDSHELSDQEKFLIVNQIDLTKAQGKPIIAKNNNGIYHSIDVKLINQKIKISYLNTLDKNLALEMLEYSKSTKYQLQNNVLDQDKKHQDKKHQDKKHQDKDQNKNKIHSMNFNPKQSKGM